MSVIKENIEEEMEQNPDDDSKSVKSIQQDFNYIEIFRQECRELVKLIPSIDKLQLMNGIHEVKNRNKKF